MPRKGRNWTVEEKLDIVQSLHRKIVNVEGLAKRYGVSVNTIYDINKKTKNEIRNGLIDVEKKEVVKVEKPKPKTDQIRDICERMGYSPAEGLVAYRRLLEQMISEKEDEIAFTNSSRISFQKASSLGDEDKKTYLRLLNEIMDLKREGMAIDKELLPYLFPKLTSSSVKVEQERPPLLVIEQPGGSKEGESD